MAFGSTLIRRLAQLYAVAMIYLAYRVRNNVFIRRSLYTLLRVIVERLTGGAGARRNGFILSKNDITREWLEDALRNTHPDARVRSVNARVMGDDMGNASEMYQLRIEYDGVVDLPNVMVLKTPRNDLMNRIPFTATRMTEMEARFYEHVEKTVRDLDQVHVPTSYASKASCSGIVKAAF